MLKKLIFSPISKSIITLVSVIISGVLCSALVVEIATKDGKIDWQLIKTATTTKWIVTFFIISAVYSVATAVEENNYRKRIDDNFLEKFIQSEGLDTLAKEVTSAIKAGDNAKLELLVDMKETLVKSLGKKS